MIKDRFGSSLEVGDWAVYVPVSEYGSVEAMRWGRISRFQNLAFTSTSRKDWIVFFEDEDDFTKPYRCMKYSPEEMTIKKLNSGL